MSTGQSDNLLSQDDTSRQVAPSSPSKANRQKGFRMEEISTTKKKNESKFEVHHIPISKKKCERRDTNGIIINHKNRKKVKISFRDNLKSTGDKNNINKLVEYIEVESWKEFNHIAGGGDLKDYYFKEKCS